MSYPKAMTKTLVVGHKKHLETTVDALYEADVLHVEDFVEGNDSDFAIGMPIAYGEEVSRKLIRVRSIANALNIKPTDETAPMTESQVTSELDSVLARMDKEIDQNSEELSRLDARVKDIESAEKELEPFLAFDLDLESYKGYDNLAVISGTVSSLNESRLLEVTDAYQLLTDPSSKFIVLFVSKDFERGIQSALADMGFREAKAPDKSGYPSDIYAALEAEKSEIQAQIESLIAARAALNQEFGDFILASDEYLSTLSEKAELPLRIATSEHTFIVEGWVPTENFDEFTASVSKETDNGVYITTLEINEQDAKEVAKVPVKYNNVKVAGPMELVTDLYGRPKYKELDPSLVLAISFPLLYGIILGDMGYAMVLTVLALLLIKFVKSDAVKKLAYVLIYCQISAFIFGILYGEFMGFPLAGLMLYGAHQPGLIPGIETIVFNYAMFYGEPLLFPIYRPALIMTFIACTATFGLLHLNFGLLLGFFSKKNQYGLKTAILKKLSWFVLQFGIFVAIAAWYFELFGTVGIAVGVAIAVVGLVMLLMGEGVLGLIEIPSFVGNFLSYTRLIAVGLSSIYIASTVNTIAFEMIWSPASGFSVLAIASILVFVLGHSLNTVLSILAPGLHALRLQYVEFFGKFYEGGGIAYKPFGHLRKYILEE